MNYLRHITYILTALFLFCLLWVPVLVINDWHGKTPTVCYLVGVCICAFVKDGAVWLGKRFAPNKKGDC